MEKLIEKQYFYVSEFKQEGAWLSFMHRVHISDKRSPFPASAV